VSRSLPLPLPASCGWNARADLQAERDRLRRRLDRLAHADGNGHR
jgi:hypothetical protein